LQFRSKSKGFFVYIENAEAAVARYEVMGMGSAYFPPTGFVQGKMRNNEEVIFDAQFIISRW